MKKFSAAVLALVMAFSMAACSSNNGQKGSENTKATTQATTEATKESSKETNAPAKDATPEEIEAAIAKKLGDGYLCTVNIPEEELSFGALGYVDLTTIEKYVAKQTTVPSVNLDNVIVVKCKPGTADKAVEGFNQSLAQTVEYIRQYPFGVAKVEGTRICKVGDTVVFVMAGAAYEGENAEEAAKLAKAEYAKVDEALSSVFGSVPENLAVIPKA